MYNLSVYEGVRDVNSQKTATLDNIILGLQGEKMRDKILKLRKQKDKVEFDKLKLALPAVTFSGKFSSRREQGIVEYSGLAVLDFDKVEVPDDVREELALNEYARLVFVSPSGAGVKLVLKFPGTIEEYRDYYAGAIEEFKDYSPDIATSDPCRLCFLSYDPKLHDNPNAKEFDKKIQRIEITREIALSDYYKIFERLKTWAEKRGAWAEGSRNAFVSGLSCACCRFGIPEEAALHYFLQTYQIDREYTEKKIHGYFKSAYNKFRGNYGTEQFTNSGSEYIAITKSTGKKVGDEIFDVPKLPNTIDLDDSCLDRIVHVYENGHGVGRSTGIFPLDESFRLGKGRLTLFGGIPQHGKTQFTKVLMMLQAVYHGEKWQVFGPEDFPSEDFYLELIQVLTGENVFKQYGKQIDKHRLLDAAAFVKEHFWYVYPEDEPPTPELIFKTFEQNIIEKGCTGCLIDPFNQMENDIMQNGGREDLYIGRFASSYKRFGQRHDVFSWVTAHPNSDVRPAKGSRDPDMPNQFNFSGGQVWNAKCDDIVIVHRPQRESDPKNVEVWIETKKIKKQRQFGVPGRVELKYNAHTGRYHHITDYDYFPKFGEQKADDNPFNDIDPI